MQLRALLRQLLKERDFRLFLGIVLANAILIFMFNKGQDGVGAGVWMMGISIMISFPIGLILFAVAIATLKLASIGNFFSVLIGATLILVLVLIGFYQWFIIAPKRKLLLKVRRVFIPGVFLISLFPYFLKIEILHDLLVRLVFHGQIK
jgi:hypothetical protein